MSKLWTFGDSFTAGNGILPNEPYPEFEKLKRGMPWPVILSQKLGLELKNKGVGMFSNDKIIDTIITNYHYIEKGDVVIVGKTFPFRIDIPSKADDELLTVAPSHFFSLQNKYTEAEMQSINETVVLFDSLLIKQRQDLRFSFLEQLVELKAKCVLWDVVLWDSYETITQATGGVINDSHWSYKGHEDFADFILNKITINKPALTNTKSNLI